MEQVVRDKIEEYVKNAYNAVHIRTMLATSRKIAESRERLAATGNLVSSASFLETIEIRAEQIKLLVEARTKETMTAYELYDAPLDDSIIHETQQVYESMLGSTAAEVHRDSVLSSLGPTLLNNALMLLQRQTADLMHELRCELERRKVMQQKKKKLEYPTTIEIHGPNARANINSVDYSVNAVTITEQNVFSEARKLIKSDVPEAEQEHIAERLTALESSIHTPSAMQRYKEYAALAAQYGNLLLLLPKLLEMAKHVAHSL